MSRRFELAIAWALWWTLFGVWDITGQWRFGVATILPILYIVFALAEALAEGER